MLPWKLGLVDHDAPSAAGGEENKRECLGLHLLSEVPVNAICLTKCQQLNTETQSYGTLNIRY